MSPVIDGGGQATPPSRTMLTPTPRQHDAAAAYAEATTPAAEPERPEAEGSPTAAVENAAVKGEEGRKTPPGFFTSITIATLLIIYEVSKRRKNGRKKKNKKNAKKKA
ncbi:MAG TPA: hypothetical protein ENF26_05100 [Methanomicrobia archaeon]|nr:hypothetical protein [Methanomicrobia archaeon]HEX59504.1 hypothetical protein [Methanomicrobia archaeon]